MTRHFASFCLGTLLLGGSAWAGQPPVQPPPPQAPTGNPPGAVQPAPAPQAPTPAAGAAVTPPPDAAQLLLFGSDIGIVMNPIKTDKTADFELVMTKVREALLKSSNPVRQQQAASWKLLKAAEPGPTASVLYIFLMQPPVANADYTVSRILAEGFPMEVDALWTKLRDAYAAPMHRLTLQYVVPAAAPTGKTEPPAVKKPD